MQVALCEQCFLDASLYTFAEQCPVRQDQPCPSTWLKQLHEQDKEKVSRLAGSKL